MTARPPTLLSSTRGPTRERRGVASAGNLPHHGGRADVAYVGVGSLLDDDTAFMLEIDAAVDSLWDDVVRDRCASREWYDVDTKTWMEPTAERRASICKGPRAVAVTKERPVTSPEWLTSFNLWMQDWSAYKDKHSFDAIGIGTRPNREDLDVWKKQLDGPGGWREQFVTAGGATIRPKADAPKPATGLGGLVTPILWVLGLGIAVYAGVSIFRLVEAA